MPISATRFFQSTRWKPHPPTYCPSNVSMANWYSPRVNAVCWLIQRASSSNVLGSSKPVDELRTDS